MLSCLKCLSGILSSFCGFEMQTAHESLRWKWRSNFTSEWFCFSIFSWRVANAGICHGTDWDPSQGTQPKSPAACALFNCEQQQRLHPFLGPKHFCRQLSSAAWRTLPRYSCSKGCVTRVKSCDRNNDGTGEQLHSRSVQSYIACFVKVCDFGYVAHGWLTNKHSKHIRIVHTSPAPKALQLPKSTEGHEPKADKKFHCLNIGRYKP